MDTIKSWIIWIIVVCVVFGTINFVFLKLQDWYYSDEMKEMSSIEGFLNIEKKNIESLEPEIKSLENLLVEKEEFLAKMESLGFIEQYNLGIEEYNDLIYRYSSKFDEYEKRISSYNVSVDKYNEIAGSQAGKRWIVYPVPAGKHSSSKSLQ